MREVFVDGFSFRLQDNVSNVDKVRKAMEQLVKDNNYWEGVRHIVKLNKEAAEIRLLLNRQKG